MVEFSLQNVKKHRIQIFSANGQFLHTFGEEGTAPGQLNWPCGIVVDHQNRILVAEHDNNRISMFSSEGNYLSSFGNGKGQLNRPVGITIDRKQNRIIVTEYHNRVSVFNDNFEWLLSFGSYGDLNGEFNYPMGVAVSDGRILVTDCNNHRIQVFTSNGQFLFSFGSKGSEPDSFRNLME